MAERTPAARPLRLLTITVVTSLAAQTTKEWPLQLAAGSSVEDALRACGLNPGDQRFSASIWGRNATLQKRLHDEDRVEWCRALLVDPKVARRERFAKQGSRGTGLFSKRKPGAQAGY